MLARCFPCYVLSLLRSVMVLIVMREKYILFEFKCCFFLFCYLPSGNTIWKQLKHLFSSEWNSTQLKLALMLFMWDYFWSFVEYSVMEVIFFFYNPPLKSNKNVPELVKENKLHPGASNSEVLQYRKQGFELQNCLHLLPENSDSKMWSVLVDSFLLGTPCCWNITVGLVNLIVFRRHLIIFLSLGKNCSKIWSEESMAYSGESCLFPHMYLTLVCGVEVHHILWRKPGTRDM